MMQKGTRDGAQTIAAQNFVAALVIVLLSESRKRRLTRIQSPLNYYVVRPGQPEHSSVASGEKADAKVAFDDWSGQEISPFAESKVRSCEEF